MAWRVGRLIRRFLARKRPVEVVYSEPVRLKMSGWARLYPQKGEWPLAEVTYVIYMEQESRRGEWWGALRLIRGYRLPPEGIQANTSYILEFRDTRRREVVTSEWAFGPAESRMHYFRGVGPL